MASRSYINEEELANNPAARVPVCLCLDLSGSMQGTKLTELQKGVELFFEAIKEDELAVDAAEIAIVGFNNQATCLLDFAPIDMQSVPKLSAGGGTYMGEGVNLALEKLEERKSLYRKLGIQYYQPWIVLMTDGEANGSRSELSAAMEKTTRLVNERKLTVFPIAIGSQADMQTLKGFSPSRDPLRLEGLRFGEFFQWLSQSISRTSVSNPGESVDLPSPKGWASL